MHLKASVFFQVAVAIGDYKSSSNLRPLTISRVLLISSFTNTYGYNVHQFMELLNKSIYTYNWSFPTAV